MNCVMAVRSENTAAGFNPLKNTDNCSENFLKLKK
jgi:hypothetical protein